MGQVEFSPLCHSADIGADVPPELREQGLQTDGIRAAWKYFLQFGKCPVNVTSMTPEEFQTAAGPSPQWTPPLRALWLDAAGMWEEAHQAVQDDAGPEAAWVHAYLHRKEGDISNARYWYARAGRNIFDGPLEEEWKAIAAELLDFPAGP